MDAGGRATHDSKDGGGRATHDSKDGGGRATQDAKAEDAKAEDAKAEDAKAEDAKAERGRGEGYFLGFFHDKEGWAKTEQTRMSCSRSVFIYCVRTRVERFFY